MVASVVVATGFVVPAPIVVEGNVLEPSVVVGTVAVVFAPVVVVKAVVVLGF